MKKLSISAAMFLITLSLYGQTDFLIIDSCGSEMKHNAPDSPESLLVQTGGHGPGMHNDKYFKMMTDFFLREASEK